jgi:hypothetical protein
MDQQARGRSGVRFGIGLIGAARFSRASDRSCSSGNGRTGGQLRLNHVPPLPYYGSAGRSATQPPDSPGFFQFVYHPYRATVLAGARAEYGLRRKGFRRGRLADHLSVIEQCRSRARRAGSGRFGVACGQGICGVAWGLGQGACGSRLRPRSAARSPAAEHRRHS